MALHIYTDAGPKSTNTIDGPVTVTEVVFLDGADELRLIYTDLDALDEGVRLMEQARTAHIVALLDGKSETVAADELKPDDLVVLDGELVCVDYTVIDGEHLSVLYGKKYQGTYDMTAGRSIRCRRGERVKRLVAGATLAVVR